jgi:CRP-like cAMP-binding protein
LIVNAGSFFVQPLAPSPGRNRLLAILSPNDRRQVLERCEPVELVLSEVLQEPGAPIRRVLFPTHGFVSLLTPVDGHGRMETGLIGNEGMLGTALVLGVARAPALAMVQGAGTALQMSARLFRAELTRSDKLRTALERYVHVVMCQLAQTIVCTRFHVVEERLARWLLMTSDRAHSDDFHITHEFLASMLGVRRAGVTRAAGALDARDLLRYRRGDLSILDRPGLERAACVCYATDRTTYSSALGRGRNPGFPSVR